jgi:hypothetical protein
VRERLSPDISRLPPPRVVVGVVIWSALMIPVALWGLENGDALVVAAILAGIAPGLWVDYWQERTWTAAGKPPRPRLLRVVLQVLSVSVLAVLLAIVVQQQSPELFVAVILLGPAIGAAQKHALLRIALRDAPERPA